MPATPADDFPAFCRAVQERHRNASPDGPRPEYPFCLDGGNGNRLDAMGQLVTTLVGFVAILLGLASAITTIFTFGLVLLILAGLAALLGLIWFARNAVQKRLGEAWRREARAWPAALVFAHRSVLEPGNSIVPGAMVVDFGLDPDPERLEAAADAARRQLDGDLGSPAHAAVRDWLQLETQRARFGRIRLPKDLAGNETTWLISLRFDRKMMPRGFVDRSRWFVKARADRDESAEILPHRFWAEAGQT